MALTNEDIINAVSEMSVMQVVELIKAMMMSSLVRAMTLIPVLGDGLRPSY